MDELTAMFILVYCGVGVVILLLTLMLTGLGSGGRRWDD